eukprot:1255658-Pyramimonas_sp.AAC.1
MCQRQGGALLSGALAAGCTATLRCSAAHASQIMLPSPLPFPLDRRSRQENNPSTRTSLGDT